MKKIVSVLVILALVCGAVFAVDVNLQVRLASNLLTVSNLGADNQSTKILDLGDISGRDNLVFASSNQNAGVKFALQPDFASMLAGKDLSNSDNNDPFKRINEMSLYVRFFGIEFGAGKWQDGKYTAEQCKVDGDNTNWSAAGKYAQLNKLGIITGGIGKEFDSLVNVKGGGTNSTNVAGYAEYSLTKVLPGKLTFRGVFVEYGTGFDKEDDDVTFNGALGFLVMYNQPKVVKVNLDLQFIPEAGDVTSTGFGIYASPLGIKNLSSVFGLTMAFNNNKDADKKTTDMGIDARARYMFAKGLYVTTCHNFSIKSLGKDDSTKQLWNQVNVLYALNDWIDLTFNAQSAGVIDEDGNYSTRLYFTAGPSFKAGEGMITTGVHFDINNIGVEGKDVATTMAIPCIFRVKM